MGEAPQSPIVMTLHERLAKIRYKGIFDLANLYKKMYLWAEERDYEFYERAYKHKWRGKTAEIELKWTMEQELNSFSKAVIRVHFHLWEYKELDVVKDGVRKRMNSARMFIDYSGELQLDWQKRWSDTWWKRKLRDFYLEYALRQEIATSWWDKLWYNANKLQQLTKRELGMESESNVYDDMW